jgi:hypothetical protein
VFALLDDVREDLRATGDIADWMATTTVCLPAKLHRPVLLEGARRNLHMRLPGLQRQVSSACGVTKASVTRKPFSVPKLGTIQAQEHSLCRHFQ